MTVGLNVTPDPDPTPTATPWQEYLAAAQSLDAVVREAASEAAATAQAVRDDLARLQAELDRRQAGRGRCCRAPPSRRRRRSACRRRIRRRWPRRCGTASA